jgi:8-oxo-dGTP pyrophosphatase MutT (NUDIX family)
LTLDARSADRLEALWQACQVHANEPLPAHWLPLVLDQRNCGWLDPETARCLLQRPTLFELNGGRLTLLGDWHDSQARSKAMDEVARRLHQAGIVRAWRSEQLDVWSDDGQSMATIERAACRALGIETRSVQLNAFRSDGSVVVARRAAHKLSDPDRWDNLAGGMIAAGEGDHEALVREAHEEAGLELTNLPVERGSTFRVQRMVAEGLMIETVQVFDVQLPADFVPANLDGEVSAFETLAVVAAIDAIERGDFTLQASMAILDAVRRRPARRQIMATGQA